MLLLIVNFDLNSLKYKRKEIKGINIDKIFFKFLNLKIKNENHTMFTPSKTSKKDKFC